MQRSSHHGRMPQNGMAKVRVVHNVAKGPDVDVYLDGKQVLSDVPYKKVSDYLKVPAGPHHVDVTAAGTRQVVIQADVNLDPHQYYTVIAHGRAEDPRSLALLPLQDNRACPMPGKAHVRFIHAAAGAPNVDVYATGPTLLFGNVGYGETGRPDYLPVDAGQYDLGVTAAGDDNLVLGPLPINLKSGDNFTLIASGRVGDDEAPLTALVVDDTRATCVSMY